MLFGGQSKRTQETSKNGSMNLNYLHLAQLPPASLCCPRPPSHHSSTYPWTTPYPLTTYFCDQHPTIQRSHPFPPRVRTISTLYDPLYSPALFQFKLFEAPVHSKLYPSVTLPRNISNTLSQNIHFPSQLLVLHAPRSAQFLYNIDTFSHLSKITYCSSHFLALLCTLYTPSFFLCTTSLSHPPSAASYDSRYVKQSTSFNGSPFIVSHPFDTHSHG